MQLRPDPHNETIKKIQNNFNQSHSNSNLSPMAQKDYTPQQATLFNNMQIEINYNKYFPNNHLD